MEKETIKCPFCKNTLEICRNHIFVNSKEGERKIRADERRKVWKKVFDMCERALDSWKEDPPNEKAAKFAIRELITSLEDIKMAGGILGGTDGKFL